MELYYGAYKSQKVESNLAKVQRIENLLEIIEIIPVSQELVKIKSWKKGESIDDFDLILASTALSQNMVLVTNNEKHFKGLELENWSKKIPTCNS